MSNYLKSLWWQLPGWVPFWFINEPHGLIDERLPSVELLKQDATKIRRILHPVIHQDKYLSIFRMDMEAECPLWARSNLCTRGNACTIESCCLEDLPHHIRGESIVKISEFDPWLQTEAVDHWQGMDAFDTSLNDDNPETFYDLAINTPGNTDYRGRSLWGHIYENNCLHSGTFKEGPNSQFCTEEGAYFKMISGMQTVISALNAEHSDDDSMIHFNLSYFKNAVSWNQSWISNMYFTFGMLQRSACKIVPLLDQLQCPNDKGETTKVCDSVVQFLNETSESCKSLEQMPEFMFDSLAVNAVKKLTEMSTIMDCIECEKCRLHAKVKINALQTVVKATSPQGVVAMERNDIVAFLHALDYFAEGVETIERFQVRLRVLRNTAACVIGALILAIRVAMTSYSKKSDVAKKNE